MVHQLFLDSMKEEQEAELDLEQNETKDLLEVIFYYIILCTNTFLVLLYLRTDFSRSEITVSIEKVSTSVSPRMGTALLSPLELQIT